MYVHHIRGIQNAKDETYGQPPNPKPSPRDPKEFLDSSWGRFALMRAKGCNPGPHRSHGVRVVILPVSRPRDLTACHPVKNALTVESQIPPNSVRSAALPIRVSPRATAAKFANSGLGRSTNRGAGSTLRPPRGLPQHRCE